MTYHNGFTFNGIHSDNYVIVTSKQRQIAPPITAKTLAVPGRAGAYDYGTEIGMREIKVSIMLIANSPSLYRSLARKVSEWLLPETDEPAQLIFDDEPHVYYTARLIDDSALDELTTYGRTTLTFLCANPYAYSKVGAAYVSWGSEDITFDASYSLGSKYDYDDGYYTSHSGVYTNNGNRSVGPLLVISTTGTLPTVALTANGKTMTVGPITDGVPFDVDCEAKTASEAAKVSGEWLAFKPGNNTLSFTVSGGTASVLVNFTDKYL